jgi:tRNA threonylcarbamoyladenosine biosynthesis protein TsaE
MASDTDHSTTTLTSSAKATEQFAAEFSVHLNAGDVIGLIGDLGAGKTCFVRGLARGLGLTGDVPVTSPTFTVMNIYQTRVPLYHFDLYRLTDIDDLEAVGYRDFVGGDGIAVMEWADRIPESMPQTHIRVHLDYGDGNTQRVIRVMWCGDQPSQSDK